MAYISCRTVGGRKYFYKVEGYRIGGKVRHHVLEYYGKKDPRKDSDASPIIKKELKAMYHFGDIALLYHAAEKINMIDCVNNYVPKRQRSLRGSTDALAGETLG